MRWIRTPTRNHLNPNLRFRAIQKQRRSTIHHSSQLRVLTSVKHDPTQEVAGSDRKPDHSLVVRKNPDHRVVQDAFALAALPQGNAEAAHVVDVTKPGALDKLNGGIEKVARFVNIYGGAGKKPATVDIVIVLHGDATLTILNSDAQSH